MWQLFTRQFCVTTSFVSILIISFIYKYQLGAEIFESLLIMNSTSTNDHDACFPWFEPNNFSGWLISVVGHLRRTNSDFVLDGPPPDDHDANGQPMIMNNAESVEFSLDSIYCNIRINS